MTSPTSFFAAFYNLKPDQYSIFFSGRDHRRSPYPPIIQDPSIPQIIQNWSLSQTGFMTTTALMAAVLAKIRANKLEKSINQAQRIKAFKLFFNFYTLFSLTFALRNSAWRLQGLVPNGLKWQQQEIPQLNKFDFSSNFVKNSFWKYLTN